MASDDDKNFSDAWGSRWLWFWVVVAIALYAGAMVWLP